VCRRNNVSFLYSACPLSLGWKAFRCLHCGELFFVKGERIVHEAQRDLEEDE
jgi:hypothetical protein